MLLYAKTDEDIYPENEYSMSGNTIYVKTLDLDCDFNYIRKQLDENIAKLTELRDSLIEKILDRIPEANLNGDRVNRLPNNANFRFASIEGEGLILRLDAKGINGATGSACSSKSLKASYVLSALGLEDVDVVVDAIDEVVAGLRRMSPLWDNENNKSLELDESKFTDPDH